MGGEGVPRANGATDHLRRLTNAHQSAILTDVSARNAAYFEQEVAKLDSWAEDRRLSLKRGLKEMDDEIAALKRQARQAGTLPDKLALQRQVSGRETARDDADFEFRAAVRAVQRAKDDLLDTVDQRLRQRTSAEPLFAIRWRLE